MTNWAKVDTERILELLQAEWSKFTRADDTLVAKFVRELTARGEYREPSPREAQRPSATGTEARTDRNPNPLAESRKPEASEPQQRPLPTPHGSIERAVENYGAYWHRWSGLLECEHCHADLRDHVNGPTFRRAIGRVERDRVVGWECPDCGKEIGR